MCATWSHVKLPRSDGQQPESNRLHLVQAFLVHLHMQCVWNKKESKGHHAGLNFSGLFFFFFLRRGGARDRRARISSPPSPRPRRRPSVHQLASGSVCLVVPPRQVQQDDAREQHADTYGDGDRHPRQRGGRRRRGRWRGRRRGGWIIVLLTVALVAPVEGVAATWIVLGDVPAWHPKRWGFREA